MSPTAVAAAIGAIVCRFLESVCSEVVIKFSCCGDGVAAAKVPSEAAMPITAVSAAMALRTGLQRLVLLIDHLLHPVHVLTEGGACGHCPCFLFTVSPIRFFSRCSGHQ